MEIKKILIIEDSQDDIELLKRAFQKTGQSLEISVAKDGAEAMDYIRYASDLSQTASSRFPDLILLDLKLPKVDGFQVLRFIRDDAGFGLSPVIILSSSGERKDINLAYELGANSYLKKPIDFKYFINVINVLTQYWLFMNEPPRI